MIYIFYRQCAANKPNNCRPNFFNYEKCFKNLLDTLDERCKLTVVFDGNLDGHFTNKYKSKYNFDIVQINAGGDFESNILTFEHIKSLNYIENDDLLYVLENDYLHRYKWIDAVLNVYDCNINYDMDNSYLSLYDHGDKYNRNILGQENNEWGMYSKLKSQIYSSKYGYVRETPNTCGSFIFKKMLFDKDVQIHLSGEADNTRFYILTKEPYNRKVLSFMPGFSTHLHSHYLSPYVDWQRINNNVQLL